MQFQEVVLAVGASSECETILVPGTRPTLNRRSQSAYAYPRPKPVEAATGQPRPEFFDDVNQNNFVDRAATGQNIRRKIRTDATTPTLNPMPLFCSE